MVNAVLAIVCTPIFLLGWVIGFVSRPFVGGFSAGFEYLYFVEADRVTAEAEERFENE